MAKPVIYGALRRWWVEVRTRPSLEKTRPALG
jgi:hypothetical protein